MYTTQFPHLFKPLKIRDKVVKNRIMSAPNMLFHTIDGRPDDYYIRYLEHKARGGAGIVNLGEANVCDGGNHTPEMETSEQNLTLYAEMAAAIHEHGALASVELTHGGRNAKSWFNKDPNRVVGPVDEVNWLGVKVRQMTEKDMDYIAQGFAETAAYYLKAGFDTVLVHAAHGWMIAQFLSSFVNTRTDAYGGSFENRMRFPLMILERMRAHLGPQPPLCVRLSGSGRREGDFTVFDIIDFLEAAQDFIDMVEISAEDPTYSGLSTLRPHGINLDLSETIKRSGRIRIPVYVVGNIQAPEMAEEALATGKADGISMSRALIADPYLPRKLQQGRREDITPCLRCSNCTDSDNTVRHFVCSVNPKLAREERLGFGEELAKAPHANKVLIVGGGPAGMSAAITATERGHEVVLVEKAASLGGQLRFSDRDFYKHDLREYKDFLVRKTLESGTRLLFGTELSRDLIVREAPDEIVFATGSEPIIPPIPGIESAKHCTAAYDEPESLTGDAVVIIGGGLVGIETGLHLIKQGKQVTVLEMCDEYARDAWGLYRMSLMAVVNEEGLTVITEATARAVTEEGVVYERKGAEQLASAEVVLYAVGMRSIDAPYFEFYDAATSVSLVGDALKIAKVAGAVHSGYFAAYDIGTV
ncbi:MAG: FAD-dependent oxidoreductase [Coriobacteriales bacterium]|jgi:2,4-dienoyl-CoA reductase-like NADH-dependent reductase (Old Yellow Enzyme family)/thioredoxin reductase|nr:FAD-dependent oxidoreductase [Coriobacteriales bacterium]